MRSRGDTGIRNSWRVVLCSGSLPTVSTSVVCPGLGGVNSLDSAMRRVACGRRSRPESGDKRPKSGRSVRPMRHPSTALAHRRPSPMAPTTSDHPRRTSRRRIRQGCSWRIRCRQQPYGRQPHGCPWLGTVLLRRQPLPSASHSCVYQRSRRHRNGVGSRQGQGWIVRRLGWGDARSQRQGVRRPVSPQQWRWRRFGPCGDRS